MLRWLLVRSRSLHSPQARISPAPQQPLPLPGSLSLHHHPPLGRLELAIRRLPPPILRQGRFQVERVLRPLAL